MEENKGKLALWIALGVIVGLLLSCLAGALAGSVAGYYAGRQAARLTREPEAYGLRERFGFELPEIRIPTPQIPQELPELELLPFRRGGALVMTVTEGSPADDAGLRRGDVIIEVDGVPLGEDETLAELISQYEPRDKVELRIIRRARERTIDVTLGLHPDSGRAWLGIEYRTLPRLEVPEWPEHRSD